MGMSFPVLNNDSNETVRPKFWVATLAEKFSCGQEAKNCRAAPLTFIG